MSNKLIDLIDISKSYGMQTVLDELNLYIRENEFLTLLGPSGCGKTTTLRILGGFETPDKGRVIFDGQDITLPSDDIQFDVGAIAKGYIADRLKDFLVKKGVNSAIINLGGNVLCIGSKPDGTPFKVGIQKPFADRNETEAVMDITGKSVVSSGIYERCFKQNGKLYHHILNPKTGYPYDNSLISVTIISDQSVDGDALSTTCFALGLEDGLKFAEKKGVQAVFITEDYELHYTDGFRDEIRVTDVES